MFYLFHGDDSYSQEQTLNELIGKLGEPDMLALNTVRFERAAHFPDLQAACAVVPFLASARLIICRELFDKMPAKAFVDNLLNYLPHLPETTRLIFLERKKLPSNHSLLKAAEKAENGYVKLFSRPQGSDLERWIQGQVKKAGGDMDHYAAQMLAANIGGNLQILSTEIEKLTLYKGDDGAITAEDVALLSPYGAETNIFNLVDALGNRNGKQAALLLRQKLSEGSEPFQLFAMIIRQFRLLIQVKSLAQQGLQPPAIAQSLRLHSFVAGKISQQSKQFSLDQLKRIYAHLLEIDMGAKTGKMELETALDLLVAGITAG